ncbi:MAG: hypothetical protein EPO68_13050 [Planctomycetota bacterium]|nr:MAG: hypothetical protein EPO68_13050 [Planctomycetota bacterium]
MTHAPSRRRGRASLAGLLLLALLLVLAAVAAVRVARHASAARVELGRVNLTAVDAPTRAQLAALADRVQVNYYVSRRDALPSHMRTIEQRVRDICEALRDAAPDRFDFQVVDPSSHPDFERFAAKRKASPVRVRSIERDNYSERTVWSTLTISFGAHAPAVINGLLPEHLPRLQARILAQIEQLERPRRPVAVIAGSAKTTELAAALAEDAGARKGAEVRRFEMGSSLPLPLDGDVLFWLDPVDVAPSRLRELEGWLASGRSVVIAGALRRAAPTVRDGRPALALESSGFPAAAVYSHFGLEPRDGLYLDTNCEKLDFGGTALEAPTLVRCIAPAQDFHTFIGQPNGTLLFDAPTPIALDGARIDALGWRAELLATTSDKTWTQPLPSGGTDGGAPLAIALDALAPERGEPAPKQALIVALRPNDATQGVLVACAASTPFVDGFYKREATAHWRLVRTLVDTLCSDDRLVQNQVGVLRAAPIPELAASSRALWRAFCLFLLPLLLLALAVARGTPADAHERVFARVRRALLPRAVAWRLAAGLVLVVAATALASFTDARADLSEDGLNQLAPESRAIAAQARAVRAELCFSAPDRLPPALRTSVARLEETVRAFRRAGADIAIENLEPDAADKAAREALAARGFTPLDVSTRDEEVTTVRTVYSALRLSAGARSELLRFPDAASFEQAEFRVAFALWRLRTGKSPAIAFASDTPRMSAAEEYEKQQAGLFAPRSGDVYQEARELLKRHDFVVLHVNPREPRMPQGVDALVWLQPRRATEPMLEALITHLHRGGKALLAAQHFTIQSEQYRGKNFPIEYWPRPQSPDVERFYFPELGIELVREPFFDALHTRIALEGKAKKSANEDYFAMESALPFLVRVAAANFDQDNPLLRGVGDQAFLFPAFFRLDAAKLAAHGLDARPLLWSSDRTWSAHWEGGRFIGPLLRWPPASEMIGGKPLEPILQGRVPLALDVRGQFPYPEKRLQETLYATGPDGRSESRPAPPWPSAAEDPGSPGRLVFFGCSESFKNYRLSARDFRADQLLLNTVASLALPDELARIAARRKVERGFGLVEPGRKLWWRNVVVGAAPLALVAFALVHALLGARSARALRAQGATA